MLAAVSSAVANGSPAPSPSTDGEADAVPSCYDLIGVEQVSLDQCENACIDQGHSSGGLSGYTVDNPNPEESSLKAMCSCGSKDGEYVGVLCEQVTVVPTCSSFNIATFDDCSIYCTSLLADPFTLSVSSFDDMFGAECRCSTETGDFGSTETVCKDKSDFDGPGVAGDEGDEGGDNSTNTATNSAFSAALFFFAATAQMFT